MSFVEKHYSRAAFSCKRGLSRRVLAPEGYILKIQTFVNIVQRRMFPKQRAQGIIEPRLRFLQSPANAPSSESPKIFLAFGCGCMKDLSCVEEAVKHSEEYGHSVTVKGSMRTASYGLDPKLLIGSSLLPFTYLRIVCGDGFTSHLLEKAVEHVAKSGHKLLIHGKINPSSKASR